MQFHGVAPDGGFPAHHDGVSLLEDGVGDVGDLGPGGDRIFDHRLEHVGRDDDLAADAGAFSHDGALHDGQFLNVDLDPEIAPRDHDGVGFLNDAGEVLDGLLILDFGNDQGGASASDELLAQVADVFGIAHETDRNVVDRKLGGEVEVVHVLLRENGQIDPYPRQVDVAARAHRAVGEDFAGEAAFLNAEDADMDLAIVHEHDVVHRDILVELVVIRRDGEGEGGLKTGIAKLEQVAAGQDEFFRYIAGADRGALQVDEGGDIYPDLSRIAPDRADEIPCPVVGGMAHVEPENICPGEEEIPDGLGALGRGSEGGDDLGLASHRVRRFTWHRVPEWRGLK